MDASAPPFFGHPIGNGSLRQQLGVCVSSWEFGGFSGWVIQSLGIWVRVVGNLGQGVISATAQQSGAEWRGVAEKGRGVAEKGRCIRLRRINDSKN